MLPTHILVLPFFALIDNGVGKLLSPESLESEP